MSDKISLAPAIQAELNSREFEVVRGCDVPEFLEKSDVVSLPSWPEFMMNDAIANRLWVELNLKHKHFQFALLEQGTQKWIAVGNSIPIHFSEPIETLPDAGWDWALQSGMDAKQTPNLLCALAIQILPEYRGAGLSTLMIQVMREIGRSEGFEKLVAPVRPNKKCDYPLIPMETYIQWTKSGERFDPWLRVHERLGARILKVCPRAMEIYGTVEDWEAWTGMTFQSSGKYIIPGALSPIDMVIENNRGEYIEPNVWMLHG